MQGQPGPHDFADATGTRFNTCLRLSNDQGCVSEGCAPVFVEPCVWVPNSFSPNGDGINESFQIPGIEAYPENTVVIFNRWGNKVFDAAGYDNNTVVWDGTSSKAVIGNSVPAGTYFYVIELDASTDAFKGSIQVVR